MGSPTSAGDTRSYVLPRLSPLKYKFCRSLIWRQKTKDFGCHPVFQPRTWHKVSTEFSLSPFALGEQLFFIVRGQAMNLSTPQVILSSFAPQTIR